MHADGQSGCIMFRRLRGFGLGLGFVHRASRVVGWGIDRIQLQWCGFGRIDHIVVRTCRDHDRITVSRHVLLFLVEDKSGLSLFDAEELIDVGVHLVTDVFPPAPGTSVQAGSALR